MIFKDECYVRNNCKKYNCGKCNDDYCIRLFSLDNLFNKSLLSKEQRKHLGLRIDDDGTDREEFMELSSIDKNITEFVDSGRNLYIHSSTPGNGKTSWAIRMIQSYLDKVWMESDRCRALFINVPRFFLTLKDSISNQSDYIDHIKENILTADLVVWDEVATKTLTEYEHENLLNLVNTRIDLGKSNIFTSNLNPNELKERVGERLFSRIVHLSTEIELKGKDKRIPK